MNMLQDLPRVGLAYAIANAMVPGKILKEEAREDFFQAVNMCCIEFAELETQPFVRAVRKHFNRMVRDYGYRRVHVRSSDGLCDRTSNERAWRREGTWLQSDPLPPGNHASAEERRLQRMRLSPERRREIARLGGVKKHAVVAVFRDEIATAIPHIIPYVGF